MWLRKLIKEYKIEMHCLKCEFYITAQEYKEFKPKKEVKQNDTISMEKERLEK